MRPNLSYLYDKYHYYNNLCFNGELPSVEILLNTRATCLGLTVSSQPKLEYRIPRIEISTRWDLPEQDFINTLVHEMIHVYIIFHQLKDNGDHGNLFRKIMNSLNTKYGLSISIKYTLDENKLANSHDRTRYICLCQDFQDQFFVYVTPKNRIFENWTLIEACADFKQIIWFASSKEIFRLFSMTTTPSFTHIDKSKIGLYFEDAIELERLENIIKPV